MNHLETIASKVNILSKFLAVRDVASLDKGELKKKYGIEQADLLILFGASIVHGCDFAAKVYKDGIAKEMMIVGGEGHTTDTLRGAIHRKCPEFETAGKAESDIIAYYLGKKYGLNNFIIERESTNCGNNVSNALKVIEEKGMNPKYIVILQDSSMQLRMDAGFRKLWGHRDVEIINYASYYVRVVIKDGALAFEDNDIESLWDIDHFITLQMGEIPRLSDNGSGYGPKGKDFIAHVDIPADVQEAFDYLTAYSDRTVRKANDKWRSGA